MQSVKFRFELLGSLGDMVADRGGGDVALLGKAEDHAVAAVDLGVDVGGIVGGEHVSHIAEPDHADAVDFGIEERQTGKLLLVGKLVADAHQITVVVVVGHIACRHGEVLGSQNARNGVDRHQRVWVSLFLCLFLFGGQLAEALFQLALCCAELCRGCRDLGLLGGKRGDRAGHFEVRARLLLCDRRKRLVDRDGVVVQAADRRVYLLDTAVDLRNAAADLVEGIIEQRGVGAKLFELLVHVVERAVDALQGSVGSGDRHSQTLFSDARGRELPVDLRELRVCFRPFFFGTVRVCQHCKRGKILFVNRIKILQSADQLVLLPDQIVIGRLDSQQRLIGRLEHLLGGGESGLLVEQLHFGGDDFALAVVRFLLRGGKLLCKRCLLLVYRVERVGDDRCALLCLGGVVLQLLFGVLYLLLRFVKLAVERGGYLFVERVKLFLREDNVLLFDHNTGVGDRCDAVDPLQAVEQRFADKIRNADPVLSLIVHRHHGDRQDIRVDLDQIRAADRVVPVVGQGVERCADVDRGGVHVGAVGKLDDAHGVAVARGGAHLLHTVDHRNGGLQGLGDNSLDGLGILSRVGGEHQRIGQIHIRHQVGRHF